MQAYTGKMFTEKEIIIDPVKDCQRYTLLLDLDPSG